MPCRPRRVADRVFDVPGRRDWGQKRASRRRGPAACGSATSRQEPLVPDGPEGGVAATVDRSAARAGAGVRARPDAEAGRAADR